MKVSTTRAFPPLDPDLRFGTSLAALGDGLYLRVRDTKGELRTFLLGIQPPGSDPNEITGPTVYRALDTMLRITYMSVRADDEEVFGAIAEALDAGTSGSAVR